MTAVPTAPMFRVGTLRSAGVSSLADYVLRQDMHALPTSAPDDLQLVTTRGGFDALETEWNLLFERAGCGEQMFQTFNWLWHWCNHFLADDANSLAIVTVRRAGRIVAILPLAVQRVAGLRQLVFMGAPVSQYGDALIEAVPDRDDILLRALRFAFAATRADVVRLVKVRDDAMIATALGVLKAAVTCAEDAPYIDLAAAGTYANYEARFSGKTKKNRRRQERRLADHGIIGLDWTLGGKDAAHAVRTTMVLKRAWLRTRGQLSRAFADQRTDAFFADACAGQQRPAGGQVSMITAGGEIANAAITVSAKGRQSLHILAYGMKFEKTAPGVLHIERLIEHAFATGVTALDFLAPRHAYKLEWADGAVRVVDYALPLTLAGKTYTHVYLGFVREALKAIAKATPRALAGPMSRVQSVMKALRR